jgi:hypothetical protein
VYLSLSQHCLLLPPGSWPRQELHGSSVSLATF